MGEQAAGNRRQGSGHRVRVRWRTLAAWIMGVAFSLMMTGCFTRTIYVPDGKAVRLREKVKAKVWVLDADGKFVPCKMTLPEGWYCLPASPGD